MNKIFFVFIFFSYIIVEWHCNNILNIPQNHLENLNKISLLKNNDYFYTKMFTYFFDFFVVKMHLCFEFFDSNKLLNKVPYHNRPFVRI